jgi:3-O-methylgallate 3,4-dioxygenase
MANLVGCVAMSHAPQLMLDPGNWHLLNTRKGENLPDKPELANETDELKWSKWRGCINAIERLRGQLAALRPEVLIVIGDDQHENLVDDNMPPFTIFMGHDAEASLSLRYLNQEKSENRTKYQIDAKLAEALITGLMDHGFDPSYSKATRYAGGLGHAFARVLKFLVPQNNCRVIPVMVNTYYPPAPSARRCVNFGQTLAELIRNYPGQDRVVIAASGGLSHTKIDEALDEKFLAAIKTNDTSYMSAMPSSLFREGVTVAFRWSDIIAAHSTRTVELANQIDDPTVLARCRCTMRRRLRE